MNATFKPGCSDYQLAMLLCIECSRVNPSKESIEGLLKGVSALNAWPFLGEMISTNSSWGLVWNRIQDFGLIEYLSPQMQDLFNRVVKIHSMKISSKLKLVNELTSVLKKNSIRCVPFKGAYLTPWVFDVDHLHYLGDIDLLVSPAQAVEAARISEGIGFKTLTSDLKKPSSAKIESYINGSHHHLHLMKKMVLLENQLSFVDLEIHRYVAPPHTGWNIDVEKTLSRAELVDYFDNGHAYQLDPVDSLLTLAIHAHYSYSGLVWIIEGIDLSLKWFVDCHWLLEKKWNETWTAKLLQRLSSTNLGPVVCGYIHLTNDVFPSPTADKLLTVLEAQYSGDQDIIYDHLDSDGAPWSRYKPIGSWPVSFHSRLMNPDRGRLALPFWLSLGDKVKNLDRHYRYLKHREVFEALIWSSRNLNSPRLEINNV